MGREDFTKIPGGLPGVETRGELIYSYGVAAKKLSLSQMCRVLCENPAKLYGLYPRKGILAPGSDGDIVVYDPGDSHVIRGEDCISKAGYTPYEALSPQAASALSGSGAARLWSTALSWKTLPPECIFPVENTACNVICFYSIVAVKKRNTAP